jgi:hypothetical protein
MKLNTTIASVYQAQQRLTGLFVSVGSMLAIILELGLIVAGFAVKGSESTSNVTLWLLFGVAGLVVALMITKLTLTNATKLRTSLDSENQLRGVYKERSKGKGFIAEDVQAELDKDIRDSKSGRMSIYILIGIGALASIVCETFVMQFLFKGLQPAWAGDILSIFLSTLVTSTVVSGELHKERDADIIRKSLSHDSFLELAAKANVYDAFNQKILAEASTHVEEVLDSTVLATYARTLVFSSIEESTGEANFALHVEGARQKQLQIARMQEDTKQRLLSVVRGEEEVHTEPTPPIQPIQLHPMQPVLEPIQGAISEGMICRRNTSDFSAKIEKLYHDNPAISPAQVAKIAGCTYHTAKKWLERVKPVED